MGSVRDKELIGAVKVKTAISQVIRKKISQTGIGAGLMAQSKQGFHLAAGSCKMTK